MPKPIVEISAFILAAASAYSLSFAVDLLLGEFLGTYQSTAFLPVVTWSIIAATTGLIALRIATRRFLAIPSVVFGLLALMSGITRRRYSLLVGLVMFGQAIVVWFAAAPSFAQSDARAAARSSGSQGSVRKVRRGIAPIIGPYRLDTETSSLPHISELTPSEKAALGAEVQFKSERIYQAPPATFSGVSWEVILGAVDNRIYKISALFASRAQAQRDAEWRNVDTQLQQSLGPPANASATIMAWDTEDGNVVVNRAERDGSYFLVLTLTSRAVSGFVRIK
jgi:hypothetical protein